MPAVHVAREAVAASTLAGIVVVVFLFVAAAASGPFRFVRNHDFVSSGLPGWIKGPLDGLSPGLGTERLIVLSVLLFALYLAAVALSDAMRFGWVVAALLAVNLILLLGPPFWLTDAFNYLGFA